jgi:hypothetical protein
MNIIQPKLNDPGQKQVKIYSGNAGKVLKLIGRGNCNQAQAAKACGLDESYVSQLMAEEDFQLQVAQMIQEAVEAATVIDQNYDDTEKLLSERLKAAAGMMFNADTILKTLKFVNEAKKRMAPVAGGLVGANGNGSHVTVVQLTLPAAMRHEYTVNPNGEVLEVNGMELQTIPSASMEQFSKQNREAHPKVDPKQLRLPNVSGRKQGTDPWADL